MDVISVCLCMYVWMDGWMDEHVFKVKGRESYSLAQWIRLKGQEKWSLEEK